MEPFEPRPLTSGLRSTEALSVALSWKGKEQRKTDRIATENL